MKSIFVLLMLAALSGRAQEIPLNANIILVHDVSFNEVVNRLLDSGYTISKIDSNYKTAQTDPKNIPKENQQIILKIRIKDSVAEISGLFGFPNNNGQNKPGSLAAFLAGVENPIANLKAWQKRKRATPFTIMNRFALSFNKPVIYEIQ